MKRLLHTLIFLLLLSVPAMAMHITGGVMYYRFNGINNGQYQYTVTLKLFKDCFSGQSFRSDAIISVFDKANGSRYTDLTVLLTSQETISLTDPNPCINNPPAVCYNIAYYTFDVSLPSSSSGYILASQVNFRINGITNLSGASNIGATYSTEIPGNATSSSDPENNSAVFTGSDLVIVCANNEFSYSFAATDEDGDELRYSFCDAYQSTSGGGNMNAPVAPPPFPPVPYSTGVFSGGAPLGNGVTINPNTGLIEGIAPDMGIYVVTVCVQEIKNGKVVATQRKDLQIKVADCDIAAASLEPEYQLCKATKTINIANKSSSVLIQTSDWEFMDNTSNIIHTATGQSTSYTFADTGLYSVKLIINRNLPCADSTISLIRVYPGFVPNFSITGICLSKPTSFKDLTTSVYGTPNYWKWDFGEMTVFNDVSILQHPFYTYPLQGPKKVELIVRDSKGCRDTISTAITIFDKPPLKLAFKDTLICRNDNLKLQATGSGIFTWTPLVNITNPNSATPTVSPITTTTYYVRLDDNDCVNTDSVKVSVVDFVTLLPMSDTIICRTDTVQLQIVSDALVYTWTPAAVMKDAAAQNPFVFPTNAITNFHVIATIGGCSATGDIKVTTVPYPVVNAGADFLICYNTSAQLTGSTDGSSWQWTPANLLNNSRLLNPLTYPPRTTDFIFTAYDTKGCPKPSRDTITITVHPKMRISAGRDTAVIVGQPLQLHATGGVRYLWSPAANLSANDVPDPIATFTTVGEDYQYKVIGYSDKDCPDSAYINVKVFKTRPTIFIPTAFTPNNDGKNDFLRPIAVGIKNIEYFSIYNRWGQLVFMTKTNGHGWDGKINGRPEATGTYIWVVKAVDYMGAAYFEKGTSTLIR